MGIPIGRQVEGGQREGKGREGEGERSVGREDSWHYCLEGVLRAWDREPGPEEGQVLESDRSSGWRAGDTGGRPEISCDLSAPQILSPGTFQAPRSLGS